MADAVYIEDRASVPVAGSRVARVFADDKAAAVAFCGNHNVTKYSRGGFSFTAVREASQGYIVSRGAVEISSALMDEMIRLKETTGLCSLEDAVAAHAFKREGKANGKRPKRKR